MAQYNIITYIVYIERRGPALHRDHDFIQAAATTKPGNATSIHLWYVTHGQQKKIILILYCTKGGEFGSVSGPALIVLQFRRRDGVLETNFVVTALLAHRPKYPNFVRR